MGGRVRVASALPAPRAPAGAGGVRKSADPASTQLDDMVNSMLPPREWTQESGTWMQYVSKEPATRLDVITLQELLSHTRRTVAGGVHSLSRAQHQWQSHESPNKV